MGYIVRVFDGWDKEVIREEKALTLDWARSAVAPEMHQRHGHHCRVQIACEACNREPRGAEKVCPCKGGK